MKIQHVLWAAGLSGLAIVATVAWLAYRAMTFAPPTAGMPLGLASTEQLTPEAAKTLVDGIFALSLKDFEGNDQPLSQWRGKVLVVNYWATWCPPCLEEMPAFSRLQSHYASWGVQFVGIGMDDPGKLMDFAKTTPVSYPLLVGGSFGQTPGLQVKGLPYTVVIGRDGKIETTRLGRLDEATLEPLLRRLLGQ